MLVGGSESRSERSLLEQAEEKESPLDNLVLMNEFSDVAAVMDVTMVVETSSTLGLCWLQT